MAALAPETRDYTWYTKRKNKETSVSEDYNGFRIDYVFASPALGAKVVNAEHLHSVHVDKLSHSIVVADISTTANSSCPPRHTPRTCGAPSARPGAVVRGGEVIGTLRPRSSGGTSGLLLERWTTWSRQVTDAVGDQAEALPGHRGAKLGKFTIEA